MMKNWRSILKISVHWPLGLALLAFTACHPEEEEWRNRLHVVEGKEATISLKLMVPDMEEEQIRLCAAVSETRAREVQDLWVGIFNVNSGECTTNALLDINNTNAEHTAQNLPVLKTKSGESYIVAVANTRMNYGFSARTGEPGDTVLLVDLLQKAETWEDYKAITAVLPRTDEVHPTGRYFVMAGSFYPGGTSAAPAGDDWNDASGNPLDKVVLNEGTNTPSGYIHLRRLFSYNHFTVKPGPHVQMELQSWQVVNLPVMSYLQERRTQNAADVSTYFATATGSTAAYKGNYASSAASHVFEAGANENESVFDFYQFENRHTGLPKSGDVGVSTYQERDIEWKEGTGKNTGVYKSLCASAATPIPGPDGTGVNTNNFATYVLIRANVSYYAQSSDVNAPAIASPDETPPAGAVLRSGSVFYVVHLGYCEGNSTEEKSRDFNVRRNHEYKYKVTVNGLSKIAVEAQDGSLEDQPGAEGNVYDSRYIVELDAHNAVFNIKLTNKQRTDLQWVVEAPYGNNQDQGLTYFDYPFNQPEPEALRNNEFYNWIRFKPAPDSLLLAVYKEPGETDADLWTLENMRHVAEFPGIDAAGNVDAVRDISDESTARWYTVFVKEYVYEPDPNNESGTRWKMYANRPDRRVYLTTSAQISADGNSLYMQPIYTIIQKSIQTYYDILSNATTSALGAERQNENYGLNMRWSSAAPTTKLNATYGWHNTVAYAAGKPWYGANGIFATGRQVGSHYYLYTATVPAVTRQYENQPAKTYPVYRMNTVSGFSTSTYDPTSQSSFYEIMAACMNRNRDENGNNIVDKEEIKWYLATTDEYLRIVLGRESLKAPLMPFGVPIADDPGSGSASRHHYAASDYQMIWSEEGVSTSGMENNTDVGAGSDSRYAWPWQVRCLRAMGVDFSSDEEVTPAYWADKANHLIHFNYYDEASLRPAQSGTMTVHSVGDLKNRASRQLEYAVANCTNMSTSAAGDFGTSSDGTLRYRYTYLWTQTRERNATKDDVEKDWATSVNANEICAQYTQYTGQVDKGTWRVPNQVELTVMFRLGLLTGNGHWLSCTKEYYPINNPTRFISASSSHVTLGGTAPFRVRCVRDVE